MLKDGEVILYHGTSTKDIEKVLEIGYPAVEGNSIYDDVIQIMSKYISPKILTPDFFEHYKAAMNRVFWSVGNPIYRIDQMRGNARGVFVVWGEYKVGDNYDVNENGFNGAAEYARDAAGAKMGEFEAYFAKELEGLKSFRPETNETKELVSLIIRNIRPEYRNKVGYYNIFPEEEDTATYLPIVVKMKTRMDNFNCHTRVIGDIRPDEIIGVSFAEEGEKENTLSKEDFLRECALRMAQPRKICSYDFSRPKDDQHKRV